MNLVYNSDILSEEAFGLSVNDRAFQYGDGLFETIRYENGRLWFWSDHLDRLTGGMAALRLDPLASPDLLEDKIHQLLSANGLSTQPARIKIQVWRQPGGLYTPTVNEANILITARPGTPFAITHKAKIGFYKEFRLAVSPISGFKTINSLPYILAGLSRKAQALDEVILLDLSGHLAECVASNLFWFTNNVLHTPSLETGCINGVARRQLLRTFPDAQQGLFFPEVLDSADLLFAANVMGVQVFKGEIKPLQDQIQGLFANEQ